MAQKVSLVLLCFKKWAPKITKPSWNQQVPRRNYIALLPLWPEALSSGIGTALSEVKCSRQIRLKPQRRQCFGPNTLWFTLPLPWGCKDNPLTHKNDRSACFSNEHDACTYCARKIWLQIIATHSNHAPLSEPLSFTLESPQLWPGRWSERSTVKGLQRSGNKCQTLGKCYVWHGVAADSVLRNVAS